MYELVYLPISKQDIENIILYVSERLNSPTAALKLLEYFEKSIERLKEFPYSHEIYKLESPLEKEL